MIQNFLHTGIYSILLPMTRFIQSHPRYLRYPQAYPRCFSGFRILKTVIFLNFQKC